MPMLMSAIADAPPASNNAITADPVFQFLNMTLSSVAAQIFLPTGAQRLFFDTAAVNCKIQIIFRCGVFAAVFINRYNAFAKGTKARKMAGFGEGMRLLHRHSRFGPAAKRR
jgi:hypothetical protein